MGIISYGGVFRCRRSTDLFMGYQLVHRALADSLLSIPSRFLEKSWGSGCHAAVFHLENPHVE